MAKKRRSSQFKDTSQVIDIEEARKKRQEKRKKQHRARQDENAVPKRAVRASVKAGRRKKNLTYAVIILFIIAAIGLSIANIISLKGEYKEAQQQNQQLQEEKKALEQQLKDTDKDEYIEEEARKQLRMIKPGETVYIVPEMEETATEPAEKTKESKEE